MHSPRSPDKAANLVQPRLARCIGHLIGNPGLIRSADSDLSES